jgi:hypothetical protein
MKVFESHYFNPAQCRRELLDLIQLLDTLSELREKEHILPFFRARPDLAALIGAYNTYIARFDLIAFEYDMFGDFTADLVIGDSVKCAFNFIEFEDAGPQSLFVTKGKKVTREWPNRVEHGYGQIIDWFYKLCDRRNSDECEARFGKRSIEYSGTLVVGRDRYMDHGERLRLEWRQQHLIVNSKHIVVVTFDELLNDLQSRLDYYTRAAKTGD